MRRFCFIFFWLSKLFLLGSSPNLYAQGLGRDSLAGNGRMVPWQQLLQDVAQQEDLESANWEDYEQELEEYVQHPIDLNTATREDLERLPFLTPSQVEDIEYYLYHYGSMKSMAEIALIPSISWYQRQLLNCFAYVGTVREKGFPSLNTIAQYGKHEVMGMLKVPFYERKGDAKETANGYLGYKYKHGFRYQFRYGDYVKLGILGAQDAGEPFGTAKNSMGYDFYSFYLQVRKWGRWKNITVGRYRLHEGLGLILNNDFGFGKLSLLSSLGRNSNSIRVHSSRSSANYLQGIAATYAITKNIDLTAFASYRKIDATLSTSTGGIQTILKTGLHRTQKEIDKQDVATHSLIGGNVNYRRNGWHLGATAFYTSFSLPLTPNKQQLYKRFAPEGNSFWNASVDYGYISHRWTIAGETATGDCATIATINTASYLFSDHFSLMALQRFYPARYYSLFSNTFSEGSEAQDESGAYIGLSWTPTQRWSITAYSDFAYFAWPKYLTKESTYCRDHLMSILFQPVHSLTFGGRIRYKQKAGVTTERLRLFASMAMKNWNTRTSFDYTMSDKNGKSQGWMLGESAGYQWRWLKLMGHFAYFHTQDYESRLYAYEPGLLYQMNFSSYFGEGIRYTVVARSEIGKHLLLMVKLGTTNYFDRNHISTGLQEIACSSQTDLEIQMKWKW